MLRANTERSYTLYPVFLIPPMIITCRAVLQYYNQEYDIDTIHQSYSDLPSFACTCVCVCTCLCLCVLSSLEFYHTCEFMRPPPQSGYRTIPSPQESLVLIFYNHTHLPPTYTTSLNPGKCSGCCRENRLQWVTIEAGQQVRSSCSHPVVT